jgi:dihydropteroate synthase
MNYYFLVNESLQAIRLDLKPVEIIRYSSCYRYNQQFYVMIISDEVLTAPFVKYDLSYHADDAMLLHWAWAELTQDIAFIDYESRGVNGLNCTVLENNHQTFIREYRQLGDVMLIINQTPDSFSDGNLFGDFNEIYQHIEAALLAGVSIIDVGGESTKPNAVSLSTADEIARLKPVINILLELKTRYKFQISLDSYRPQTIEFFLDKIDIVNDVSGALSADILKKINEAGVSYVFMHSLTVPANPLVNIPVDTNPCDEIYTWAENKLEQLIFDMGIGFNKTEAQAWYLLRNVRKFHKLDVEILVGHSRKRFMNKITSLDYSQRDLHSAMIANFLLTERVDYIRTHDYKQLTTASHIYNQLI